MIAVGDSCAAHVGFNRAAAYIFDVRRDGVPAAETEDAKKMKEPRSYDGGSLIDSSLPPHRTETDTIQVSAYAT